jgi:hypothetical protein
MRDKQVSLFRCISDHQRFNDCCVGTICRSAARIQVEGGISAEKAAVWLGPDIPNSTTCGCLNIHNASCSCHQYNHIRCTNHCQAVKIYLAMGSFHPFHLLCIPPMCCPSWYMTNNRWFGTSSFVFIHIPCSFISHHSCLWYFRDAKRLRLRGTSGVLIFSFCLVKYMLTAFGWGQYQYRPNTINEWIIDRYL